METPAKAEQIGEGLLKARRTFAAAQLLMSLSKFREAVCKSYQATLQSGEAAVWVEGYDPKTHWGAWIQFGYLFLCHARVSPGLGRMVEILHGRCPDTGAPDVEWKAAAEAALSQTKNVLEYFSNYVRTRSARASALPRAFFG